MTTPKAVVDASYTDFIALQLRHQDDFTWGCDRTCQSCDLSKQQ